MSERCLSREECLLGKHKDLSKKNPWTLCKIRVWSAHVCNCSTTGRRVEGAEWTQGDFRNLPAINLSLVLVRERLKRIRQRVMDGTLQVRRASICVHRHTNCTHTSHQCTEKKGRTERKFRQEPGVEIRVNQSV